MYVKVTLKSLYYTLQTATHPYIYIRNDAALSKKITNFNSSTLAEIHSRVLS